MDDSIHAWWSNGLSRLKTGVPAGRRFVPGVNGAPAFSRLSADVAGALLPFGLLRCWWSEFAGD
ncbi:MAG: hypothetical protein WCQ21_04525, partial [Verrucomicrobiota bacterium]